MTRSIAWQDGAIDAVDQCALIPSFEDNAVDTDSGERVS